MERKRRSPEDRFWEKVNKTDTCWLWTAYVDPEGYGRFKYGLHQNAHRVAYEWIIGPIPPGLQIDHLCRVRNCVNPSHMEPVTLVENVMRSPIHSSLINAAKTHCPKGHPYSAENTRRGARGGRKCRECGREQVRRHYQEVHGKAS